MELTLWANICICPYFSRFLFPYLNVNAVIFNYKGIEKIFARNTLRPVSDQLTEGRQWQYHLLSLMKRCVRICGWGNTVAGYSSSSHRFSFSACFFSAIPSLWRRSVIDTGLILMNCLFHLNPGDFLWNLISGLLLSHLQQIRLGQRH